MENLPLNFLLLNVDQRSLCLQKLQEYSPSRNIVVIEIAFFISCLRLKNFFRQFPHSYRYNLISFESSKIIILGHGWGLNR